MKIGISINTSWNVFNFRKGIVLDLLKEGNEVFVIAPKDDYSVKLEELGCVFIELPMKGKSYNPFIDLLLLFRYVLILRNLNLDYLLTYTIKPNVYGAIASVLTKTRVLSNVSGLGTTFLTDSIGAKIAQKLYKVALKYSYKVFFQNYDDRKLFIESGLIKESKTDVLPGSGVDLKTFKTARLYPEKVCFTVIARTLFAKGINEYIEAIRSLKSEYPDAEFLWVGKPEPEKGLGVDVCQMEEWENESLIQYIPFTDDIKEVIERSTCIVLPSYREGTPKSLLEGMAMSRPVITTNVPGCKDVVLDNENGFLCEARSVASLRVALRKMLNTPISELTVMGEKSRMIVEERYSQEIVIEKYKETIQA